MIRVSDLSVSRLLDVATAHERDHNCTTATQSMIVTTANVNSWLAQMVTTNQCPLGVAAGLLVQAAWLMGAVPETQRALQPALIEAFVKDVAVFTARIDEELARVRPH